MYTGESINSARLHRPTTRPESGNNVSRGNRIRHEMETNSRLLESSINEVENTLRKLRGEAEVIECS